MAAKKQLKETDFYPPAACAYIACQKASVAKVKVMANAWADYCLEHYLEYYQRRAEDTCFDLKLSTVPDKRAYVKDAVGKLSRKMRPNYLDDE